ncbi:NAD-dependent epimerase/dehydratase family protein [Arenicella xantha]|uniref:Nucleoside-diphosphate-sugar epimerase n=1 Tax=Arenicella xantha TaxID=644221 RepID=A0A395JHA7_9GAMM|nr:NAD-dependent epimerase/dehydratase family protein [Arenicella xantha]RBP47174.1 nucleoside-diphosphate-sugar epimerase [Arenicella xantha]
MRIIVTGAGGFVGRALVSRLADLNSEHRIVAIDNAAEGIPSLPNVIAIAGDLRDVGILKEAFVDGCDAVVHLATMPGGAAEQNPDTAWQVNVEATMMLAEIAASGGASPRFVFASSIAALGKNLPSIVDDNTALAPSMLYGAHKAMMEQWLATLTRRGVLDAISLRLSGVVARPKGPSGMKSAFMSDVFHALINGERFVMPVSQHATCWLSSLDSAVSNFVHALPLELECAPPVRAVTLPALHVTIGNLVAEIATQTGQPKELISYAPEAELDASFGRYPPLHADAARALQFGDDLSLTTLVRRTLSSIMPAWTPQL